MSFNNERQRFGDAVVALAVHPLKNAATLLDRFNKSRTVQGSSTCCGCPCRSVACRTAMRVDFFSAGASLHLRSCNKCDRVFAATDNMELCSGNLGEPSALLDGFSCRPFVSCALDIPRRLHRDRFVQAQYLLLFLSVASLHRLYHLI